MTIRARHLTLAGIITFGSVLSHGPSVLAATRPPAATPRTTTNVRITTAATSRAARTYLAIVTPANKAIIIFANKSKLWTRQTPSAQAETEARPVIAALQLVRVQLQADHWPAQARVGIRVLASELGPMVHDLQALARVNMNDPSEWLTTFEAHEMTVATQGRIVRHALRLPPAA
jgi:hypothetical protein